MPCTTCFDAYLRACPGSIVLDAGLSPNTQYYWCLIARSGKLYQRLAITGGTGKLTIDCSVLPPGLLSVHAGNVRLVIRSGSDYLITTPLTINGAVYTCLQLHFQATDGEGQNNFIYSEQVAPSEPLSN